MRGSEGDDNSVEGLVLDLWGEERAEQPDGRFSDSEGEADPPDAVEAQAPPVDQAGPAVRLAWSAAYGVKAACLAVAAFVASAIALTMVFNPDLTLLDAINLFISKTSEFVGGIGR